MQALEEAIADMNKRIVEDKAIFHYECCRLDTKMSFIDELCDVNTSIVKNNIAAFKSLQEGPFQFDYYGESEDDKDEEEDDDEDEDEEEDEDEDEDDDDDDDENDDDDDEDESNEDDSENDSDDDDDDDDEYDLFEEYSDMFDHYSSFYDNNSNDDYGDENEDFDDDRHVDRTRHNLSLLQDILAEHHNRDVVFEQKMIEQGERLKDIGKEGDDERDRDYDYKADTYHVNGDEEESEFKDQNDLDVKNEILLKDRSNSLVKNTTLTLSKVLDLSELSISNVLDRLKEENQRNLLQIDAKMRYLERLTELQQVLKERLLQRRY